MARVMLLILGTLAGGPILGTAPTYAEPAVATDAALDRWQGFIAEASRRFSVPEAWIRALMQAESGGRTMLDGRPMTSRAGAMGLMQVLPDTYEEMRHLHGLGSDAYDPRDNIPAGAAYLRAMMYDRYGYLGLLAAYNAGPERYDEYLHDGRPLPAETRAYLATIAETDRSPSSPSAVLSGTRLFFTLRTAADASPNADKASASSDLFVPLTTVPDGQR